MDSPGSHGSAKLAPSIRPQCVSNVCMQVNQLFPHQLPFLPFLPPKDHKDPEKKNPENIGKTCGKCEENIWNTELLGLLGGSGRIEAAGWVAWTNGHEHPVWVLPM